MIDTVNIKIVASDFKSSITIAELEPVHINDRTLMASLCVLSYAARGIRTAQAVGNATLVALGWAVAALADVQGAQAGLPADADLTSPIATYH